MCIYLVGSAVGRSLLSLEVQGFWLKYCWPSVADGGSTLFHNWANVSCYPCSGLSGQGCRKITYIYRMLGCCWAIRQTRWITIEATLVCRPVVAIDAGVEKACGQCWSSVEQGSYTINRHWTRNGLRLCPNIEKKVGG